jgi:hypothetical protein
MRGISESTYKKGHMIYTHSTYDTLIPLTSHRLISCLQRFYDLLLFRETYFLLPMTKKARGIFLSYKKGLLLVTDSTLTGRCLICGFLCFQRFYYLLFFQ